jgi:hypothetical protein
VPYSSGVPVLSAFFGILIRMFYEDHAPPHFHVEYAEFKAVIELETGRVLGGQLPIRCRTLVEEWRNQNLPALRAAWEATGTSRPPKRIKPLR